MLPAALIAVAYAGACGSEAAPPVAPPTAVRPAQQELAAPLAPAFALVNDGQFDEARALIADVLQQDAGLPDYQAEFLLGYSFQKQKLYAEARQHFLRAVELQPDYHPAHHFLGFAHYYLGETGRARAAFLRHIEQSPGEGDDHFGIGLCDLDEGRLEEAERRFATAIELHTAASERGKDRRREVAKCRARLGDVYELRGDLVAARAEYEQAVSLWPAHYEVWHKLDRVLVRLGEDELAALARQRHDEWREQVTASR